MVKIILRGCNGRMGQEISKLVKTEDDFEIVAGIDRSFHIINEYKTYKSFSDCDVKADAIIDFSSPENMDELIEYAKVNKLPIVYCTTGLSQEDINKLVEASKVVPILRSANMSLGINVVLKLLQESAKVLTQSNFDIEIVEKHHNQKVDAPSGTALLMADAMNEVLNNEYSYTYDRSTVREKRPEKEIGISAVRGGSIIGEHEVIFAGLDEVIEIKHTAYSRVIFAKGAIYGAKYLQGREPGMYQLRDLINL